jgi:uncharacterized membrane protein
MPSFSLKQRLKIAIGGFVSFVGLMMLTRTVNLESVMQNELIVAVVAIVGILDVICGFLLLRKT